MSFKKMFADIDMANYKELFEEQAVKTVKLVSEKAVLESTLLEVAKELGTTPGNVLTAMKTMKHEIVEMKKKLQQFLFADNDTVMPWKIHVPKQS